MLKSKDSYANNEVYEYNRFMELATVRSYVLSPSKRTQVKFLLNNKDVEELNQKPRFLIITPEGRSRTFYYDGAKLLLGFINTVRTMKSGTLELAGGAVTFMVKNETAYVITAVVGGNDERIIEVNNLSKVDSQVNPNHRRDELNKSLDRFEAIVQAFIDMVDGKENDTVPYFEQGRWLMYPLHNTHTSINGNNYLRLNWSDTGKVNKIRFSNKGKDCLFYSPSKENTSSLSEISEGFIDGIYRLVDEFDKVPYSELDSFRKALPVILSDDRKEFMEYVGGRGISATNYEGEHRVLIINVNSDAAPYYSKTMFHYDKQFVNDLIDGLRFLYNYEIK